MRRAALLLIAGALLPAPLYAAPRLSAVWSDHIVIQRGQPIRIEGTATPGEAVTATLGRESGRGVADREGRFTLAFPARAASNDPLTLTVRGDDGSTTTVSDILIGDVWLCSGQSNMEWPVSASVGGNQAAQASADDGLRLLSIPKDTAATPQDWFSTSVRWETASPDSVAPFSAACYYMARELRKDRGIPIGAINSNWGGSQVRAWLSPEAGQTLYGTEQMKLLQSFQDDPLAAVTAFAPTWESWWRDQTGGQEPWHDPEVLQWQPVPSITAWPGWDGTRLAEDPIGNVWFRRTLRLTPEQAAQGGRLAIGVIDDMDTTWVNGRIVGNTFGWSQEREYAIPPEFLRAGDNEIVFAASNSWGSGGFASTADRLAFTVDGGERIPLGDGWRYAVGSIREMPPRAPWDANAGIGVMHNRMIAPLGDIRLAGAAWYQGESDVDVPGYADRLRELFAGWRRQFGPDMRMLVVQLPGFGPTADRPTPSGWAVVREDQRRAVSVDGNAALIPTLDVGQRDDLHPPDKLPVGLRLAAAAQGEAMPMPTAASREGGNVRVTFSGIVDGLRAWSGAPLGIELCAESQDSCRFAQASTAGESLLIAGDGMPASRVRHAWAESPVVNLFDGRPISVPGFEIAIAP